MRISVLLGSALLLAGLSAGCQPVQPEAAAPAGTVPAAAASANMPTTFTLPDGTFCTFAGTGATLAFDGARLAYTCEASGPMTVLLGDITAADGGYSTTRGVVSHGADGFTLDSNEAVTVTITGWALEDTSECLWAGSGATLAFDGKRLNFDCGTVDGNPTGILGNPTQDETGAWTAEYAEMSKGDNGFALASSAMVTVTPVRLETADGGICLWAGNGATMAFDGQRLNYTCSDPKAPLLGLLGDPVQDNMQGAGVWTVNLATYSHGADGFTLDASEPISFFASELDLADGSVCLHAGFGATTGLDDKRLNYTCEETDAGQTGIFGDLTYDAVARPGVYVAQKMVFTMGDQGPALVSSALLDVTQVIGSDLPVQ